MPMWVWASMAPGKASNPPPSITWSALYAGRSLLGETAGRVAIAEQVDTGIPMKVLEKEHSALVADHAVFGVPTFISGDEAVFVRLMQRHAVDDIARTIDMLTWTNMNEYKRTRVPR